MSDISSLAKLVPGFDFLQGLVKNAGVALPAMGQWVAPTLNPEELQKRIDELKAVQFWLEQNARMLGTTIQAMEVQRMTLSTLQTMNVQMTDLRDAMKVAPVAAVGSAAQAAAGSVAQSLGADSLMNAAKSAMGGLGHLGRTPDPEPAPEPAAKAAPKRKRADAAAASAVPGVIDPMQWWGALTKQFGQLATNALKESATDTARHLAGAVVRQGVDAAGGTLRKAAGASAGVATKAMTAATQAASATAARKQQHKTGVDTPAAAPARTATARRARTPSAGGKTGD